MPNTNILVQQSIAIFFLLLLSRCAMVGQTNNHHEDAIIYLRTQFYDSTGKQQFVDTLKIWYKDSMAIEEIHSINLFTDTSGRSSTKYNTIAYRFIDLRNKIWIDFNDTAKNANIISMGPLPEVRFKDAGWCFYSEKVLEIQGHPEALGDTTIVGILYKKIRFSLKGQDPEKEFLIGYLQPETQSRMFSLEKSYSESINAVMKKLYNFKKANPTIPYASMEVDLVSKTLPYKIQTLFSSWREISVKTQQQ